MRTNLIITDVKSYLIPEDPQIDGWCKLRPNIIVRIETESGLSGWGECYVSAGHENAICSLVDSLGRSLLGKDASNIRAFTKHAMADFSNQFISMDVASATSGIELAMWDTLGKSLDTPVYQLLGGAYRDEIPLYANMWTERSWTTEETVKKALEYVESGFDIVKFYPMWHAKDDADCVARVKAIRDAIGPDIGLAIDFVRRVMPEQLRAICRQLESTNLAWVEDPVPPHHTSTLKWLREHIQQPLLAGESIGYKYGFADILTQGALGCINPDICLGGGLLEMHEIAAIADTHMVTFSPHNYNSMTVGLSATANLAAGIRNLAPVEYFPEHAQKLDEVCSGRMVPQNGKLKLPEGPGFGLSFDDSKMAGFEWCKWD